MIGRMLATAGVIVAAVVLWLGAAVVFPGLLAFPHHRMVGDTPVFSSRPLTADVEAVVRRADARLRTSPLYQPEAARRPIYLTDGGLRWRLLSPGAADAFALTRPVSAAVVVNRSSLARDRVRNGGLAGAGERILSDVIAHETTHILIRRRFGLMADRLYPRWVVEGYCDHVAGSSTLTDAAAARLIAAGEAPPALFYYQARKRVEAALAANGGSVDALFEEARAG